ncbi:MAG: hypothetical protein AVDCRST_MAG13-2194, partial [uncultured Solirubrobacteraceae bacterium]
CCSTCSWPPPSRPPTSPWARPRAPSPGRAAAWRSPRGASPPIRPTRAARRAGSG